MSDTFEERKRDPFITEEGATLKLQKIQRVLTGISRQRMNDISETNTQRYRDSWRVAGEYIDYLLINYSIGLPIPNLVPLAEEMLKEHERHYNEPYASVDDAKLILWETNGYMYVTWLLGAAVMLNQHEYIAKIPSWITKRSKYGSDALMAALFARMGVNDFPAGKGLQFPKAYGELLKIVNASLEEISTGQREVWMATHLKGWYKNMMKQTVWGDWHEAGQENIYFGHWSLESGLITLLYGLDDSSYREMMFYPKDMVDWARENVDLTKLQPAIAKSRYTGYSVAVGEVCQETGYYECPRQQGRTILLMQGQPILGDKHNEMGAIIWYKLTVEAEREYLDNRKKNPLTGNWE